MSQAAIDLVLSILEADKRPGAQPATLFAIAERALEEAREEERERAATIATEHQRWNTKEGSEGWNIAGAIAADIRIPPPTPE